MHITPLALQLLSGKLRSDNLVLLAAIVNQKIQFNRIEPVDEGEESNLKESCDFITLGGYNPGRLTSYVCLAFGTNLS